MWEECYVAVWNERGLVVVGNSDFRNEQWPSSLLRYESQDDVSSDSHSACSEDGVYDTRGRSKERTPAKAYDIVCRLLQREPSQRLGYNGFDEIKSHLWFNEIDWEKLYRKEVVPPFRPTVKNEESTEQIDPEFTSVIPAVTPTPVNAVLTDQNAFKDFSYAEEPIH